ncbi:hypothetical protein [Streptomyces yangpuensis]|uniref:hypothetical protein n=1 Tax=Streptomyces yangpuensis TaxID=1648182 RepID=UPI000AADF6A7|nr:hypothetical protein [Streptomyces yangpuensis]
MQNDGVPDGWDYVATPGWPYDQFRGEPPLVDLGHLKMPSHFTGIAVGKKVRATVALCFRADPQSGVQLVSVMTGDTGADFGLEAVLEAAGIATWKHAAFMQLVNSSATEWLGETLAPQADQSASAFEQKKEEARRLLAPLFGLLPTQQTPGQRRSLTPDHLTNVAEVYREAHKQGRPPTVAVAEHFGVSHSAAAKWVGAARKQGQLGPVAKGSRGSVEGD